MARFDNAVNGAELGDVAANPDVFLELGMQCAAGRTGAVDLIAAHKWFNLAARNGNAEATRLRREIADQMSEAEIAAAQRAARAWLTTH
jgi:TPR repeat protein